MDFGEKEWTDNSLQSAEDSPDIWPSADETFDSCGTLVGEFADGEEIDTGSLPGPPRSIDYFGALHRDPDRWGVGQNSYFFVAKDRDTGVRHLVKVAREVRFGEAFMREIFILSKARHPNVCPLLFSGCLPTGERYYLQQYLENAQLLSSLKEEIVTTGDLLCRLVRVITDICDVVAYVNERGILHRDIKPSNILLWRDRGYLIDWGISIYRPELATQAMLEDNESFPGGITIAGSPAFMAPEQANSDISELDARTDTFMIGSTLYYILTGHSPRPVERNIGMVVEQVRHGITPVPILTLNPDAPLELIEICEKSMSFHKEDRYQSAMEMKSDLERWLREYPRL